MFGKLLCARVPRPAALVAGLVLLGLPLAAPAAPAPPTQAGVSAAVRGDVRLVEAAAVPVGRAIGDGVPVFLGNRIEAGHRSGMQLMLLDETVVSLGENASLVVDEFVYDPAASRGHLSLDLARGSFRLFTGGVSDLDPANMVIRTPTATIGVRGTILAIDVTDMGTLVVLGGPGPAADGRDRIGAVEVSTREGSVVLSRPGFATFVPAGAAPEAPRAATAAELSRIEGGTSPGESAPGRSQPAPAIDRRDEAGSRQAEGGQRSAAIVALSGSAADARTSVTPGATPRVPPQPAAPVRLAEAPVAPGVTAGPDASADSAASADSVATNEPAPARPTGLRGRSLSRGSVVTHLPEEDADAPSTADDPPGAESPADPSPNEADSEDPAAEEDAAGGSGAGESGAGESGAEETGDEETATGTPLPDAPADAAPEPPGDMMAWNGNSPVVEQTPAPQGPGGRQQEIGLEDLMLPEIPPASPDGDAAPDGPGPADGMPAENGPRRPGRPDFSAPSFRDQFLPPQAAADEVRAEPDPDAPLSRGLDLTAMPENGMPDVAPPGVDPEYAGDGVPEPLPDVVDVPDLPAAAGDPPGLPE